MKYMKTIWSLLRLNCKCWSTPHVVSFAHKVSASLPSTNSTVSSVSVRRDSSTRAVSQMWTSVHLTRAWMAVKACKDEVNAFVCHCVKGFEGLRGEREVDEFCSQPCLYCGKCREPSCVLIAWVCTRWLARVSFCVSQASWVRSVRPIWTTVCPTSVWTTPRVGVWTFVTIDQIMTRGAVQTLVGQKVVQIGLTERTREAWETQSESRGTYPGD